MKDHRPCDSDDLLLWPGFFLLLLSCEVSTETVGNLVSVTISGCFGSGNLSTAPREVRNACSSTIDKRVYIATFNTFASDDGLPLVEVFIMKEPPTNWTSFGAVDVHSSRPNKSRPLLSSNKVEGRENDDASNERLGSDLVTVGEAGGKPAGSGSAHR